jgi:surface antigen
MKKMMMIAACGLLSIGVGGCDTMTRQDVGVVTGGAIGALVGSQIGSGSGRAVAITAGALAGALIGGQIGRSMDRQDQQYVYQALDTNRSTSWVNPNTGNQYTVTPTSTSGYCREYQTTAVIGGKTQNMYGKACRQPDGSWKAV